MDDLISRQAAIDALEEPPKVPDTWSDEFAIGEREQWGKDVKALNSLPSAQPEQRWIPCSERLPEEDGRYLVTRYDYVTELPFVDILWYEKRTWWNRYSTGDYAVTAWMPLPEPYKEAEE